MNIIAFSFPGVTVYWSSIVIVLGICACICMTRSLRRGEDGAVLGVFFPLAIVLGLLLSRFVYWYCHIESYSSMFSALTDYSSGSFCIMGVILGAWLAAYIVRRLGLTESTGALLDSLAPGMALAIAFFRLSALFNSTCRSKIVISNPAFQSLPFAAALSGGPNPDYRFASFFISFLLMLAVSAMLFSFYLRRRKEVMWAGFDNRGNTARMFLVLFGAVELVIDSTRYDSSLMHFSLLKGLNPYASFISTAQLFAAISMTCVFIRFMRISVYGSGWNIRRMISAVIYVAALAAVGICEYKVQRTGMYAVCYTVQSLAAVLMAADIRLCYNSSRARKKRRAEPAV